MATNYTDAPSPPPLTLPLYYPVTMPGVPASRDRLGRAGGLLVTGFTTANPFTVVQYAAARRFPISIAQAVLDQAVADGRIIIV